MSNLALYLTGALIAVIALGYALHLLGVATVWILLGAAAFIGLSIMGGVRETRSREQSSSA